MKPHNEDQQRQPVGSSGHSLDEDPQETREWLGALDYVCRTAGNPRAEYLLTLMNENYAMPPQPAGSREGICRGIYRLSETQPAPESPQVRLLGSGAILREALRAQELLATQRTSQRLRARPPQVTPPSRPSRQPLRTSRDTITGDPSGGNRCHASGARLPSRWRVRPGFRA